MMYTVVGEGADWIHNTYVAVLHDGGALGFVFFVFGVDFLVVFRMEGNRRSASAHPIKTLWFVAGSLGVAPYREQQQPLLDGTLLDLLWIARCWRAGSHGAKARALLRLKILLGIAEPVAVLAFTIGQARMANGE